MNGGKIGIQNHPLINYGGLKYYMYTILLCPYPYHISIVMNTIFKRHIGSRNYKYVEK